MKFARRTLALLAIAGGTILSVGAPGVHAQVTIETVTVGNPGNAGELSGASAPCELGFGFGPDCNDCGAVDYVYRMGKFEVTAGQYTEFLNAVAAEDHYGLYDTNMGNIDPVEIRGCNIQRIGASPSFSYSVAPDWANRPVSYVGWDDTARFCNWLHNGQPTGAQNALSTEDGSYDLSATHPSYGPDGVVADPDALDIVLIGITREPDHTWVIPSEDEWYKAAYHKNDGVTGNYYDYPTSSDNAPVCECCPGGTNSANYLCPPGDPAGLACGPPYLRNEVGCFTQSVSPYGTFDQAGNVWEWLELVLLGIERGARGGTFQDANACSMHAAWRAEISGSTSTGRSTIGFRVAIFADCNSNSIPDECDLDCASTIGTTGELCSVIYPGCGGSADCNANGIPDECDIANGTSFDCNNNGIPDECDIANCTGDPACADCNNNGCPDECDLAPSIAFSQAPSLDVNKNRPDFITSTSSTVAGPRVPLDVNNDSHTDLAGVTIGIMSLVVFEGNGDPDGTFSPQMENPLGLNFPVWTTPGDCDNDGDVDFVVSDRGDSGLGNTGGLFLLRNLGAGVFTTPISIDEQACAYFIPQFMDLDRDGFLDLVATRHLVFCGPGPLLHAFRNTGNCTFAAPVSFGAGPPQGIGVVAGDFNGDAWPDVAVSVQDQGTVAVFLNSAMGMVDNTLFGQPVEYQVGDSPVLLFAGDMDNDTHVDIVVSNTGEFTNTPTIAILWNIGDGTFLPAQHYPSGLFLNYKTIADLDGDGDQDIAVGVHGGTPFILENRGNRNFVPAKRFNNAGTGRGATIADGDFNEDGRPDLAGLQAFGDMDILLNDFGPFSTDCNGNLIPDECDIANCMGDPACADCNNNGIPDDCDIDGAPEEIAKLIASDAATCDRFGARVSINAETALVGAAHDDHAGGIDAGSGYVLVRSGMSWPQQAKLTASDAAADDHFGNYVSINGDTLAVGAEGDDHSGGVDAGAVYVFVRMGTIWTQQAKLTASDAAPADRFGHSVSISGDTVVIGARGVDTAGESNSGSAYVFVKPLGGWSTATFPMNETARLIASDAAAEDEFGWSVSVSGDTTVVGAIGDDHAGGANAGSAYVFVKPLGGWSTAQFPMNETAKLIAPDASAGDSFGYVAIDGDSVAVGAIYNDHSGQMDAGAVYLFEKPVGGWSTAPFPMAEAAKLIASDPGTNDYLGHWGSVDGDVVAFGAPQHDHSGVINAGAAYVFRKPVTGWANMTETHKLVASDPARPAAPTESAAPSINMSFAGTCTTPIQDGDQFGNGVAVSGDTALVAVARDDHTGGIDAGSAYVFDLHSGATDCNANGVLDDCDIADCPPGDVTCADCNTNGIPDGCDISGDTSPDVNQDGIPDECHCAPFALIANRPAEIDLIGLDGIPRLLTANRFLIFTAGDPGRSQAIRVTPTNLPPPFDVWNGISQWVSAPRAVSEAGAAVDPADAPGFGTFQAARLECPATPHCMDWSTVGPINVFGEAIVPSKAASPPSSIEVEAAYDIQVIDCVCDRADEGSYSAALALATPVSGDTVRDLAEDPPLPPNGPPVDVVDALAILERFSNAPGAMSKARADLEPGCLDLTINVSDALSSIQGFSGVGYRFTPTASGPCASTCPNPLP